MDMKYEALNAIGEGSFGRVYRARVVSTNEIVACKIIVKQGRGLRELEEFRQECEIQRNLNHPNIVQMLDTFETEHEIFVISEFADKELSKLLGELGVLPEDRVQQITCDLVSALFYLHSHRVLHRDLKPQNVLLDKNGVAKLCDFGFARNMGTGTHVLTSVKGTPLYMAPELITATPYDHSADLWSLGCIIYELLVGNPPFCTQSLLHLICRIQNETIQWPDFISADCRDFLQGLLHKEPEKRLTWPEILGHGFLKNGTLTFENEDPVLCNKYPFTSNLSSSQKKAKELQRQEILEQRPHGSHFHSYGQQFYTPPVAAAGAGLPARHEFQPMLCGANNIHSVKTSSCPSQSVKVFSSLTENGSTKKVLHASLKSVNKSSDITNEKKLYTSLASEVAELNIYEEEKNNNVNNGSAQNMLGIDISSNASVEAMKLDANKDELPSKRSELFKKSKAVFTLHSWDSAASARPIENDEWLAFLQRNMEELMTGQLDCLRNHNLVSVVVAPLRNPSASCRVLEYVASMLALPFVVDGPRDKDLENIKQVYLEAKVIANLVYASKIIARNKGYDSEASSPSVQTGSEMLLRPVSELSADELQALERIYVLVCHLVHSGEDFLIQFCDAAAMLNAVLVLQQFLLLGRRKVRVVTDLLAILNLILNDLPENVDVVEQIVLGSANSGTGAVDLSRLLTHPSRVIRSRTCDLIKQLGLSKPDSIQGVLNPRLYQDLNTLLSDSSNSVRMAAEEALKEIKVVSAAKTG